ncbi:MAG: hypothetical protein E6Z83_04515 [Pantoea sp.]|uniref:hypothetical protein n=1 Tax=Pantoea sp. TaxID=69393 RepID=UPI002914E358|nr:hypothetical protein [Pantoea sp.]MDU5780053.1 hypothetical protein [Pantoea sp.]
MVKRTIHPARQKLIRSVRSLDNKVVSVGFFADQGNHSGSKMPYTNLMYIQEVHGVRSKAGLVHRRLFELTAMQHRNEIVSNVKNSISRNFPNSPNQILKDFGQDVKGKLREAFGDTSLLPHNAPSTIAGKGANSPLIDTGELKSKVTYRVRQRKKG